MSKSNHAPFQDALSREADYFMKAASTGEVIRLMDFPVAREKWQKWRPCHAMPPTQKPAQEGRKATHIGHENNPGPDSTWNAWPRTSRNLTIKSRRERERERERERSSQGKGAFKSTDMVKKWTLGCVNSPLRPWCGITKLFDHICSLGSISFMGHSLAEDIVKFTCTD